MDNVKKNKSGYIFVPYPLLTEWKLSVLDSVCINRNHVLQIFPTKNEFVEVTYRYLESFSIQSGSCLQITPVTIVEDLETITLHLIKGPKNADISLISSLLTLKLKNRQIILGSIETIVIFESDLIVRYVAVKTVAGVEHRVSSSVDSTIDKLSKQFGRFSLIERLDQLETRVSFPNVNFLVSCSVGHVAQSFRVTPSTLLVVDDNVELEELLSNQPRLRPAEKLFGLEDLNVLLTRIVISLAEGKARPTSVLLHGPPGCGKRSLIRSFERSANLCQFRRFEKADFTIKYPNQPELAAKNYFEEVKCSLPCLLFTPNIEDQFSSDEDGEINRRLRGAISEHLASLLATRRVCLLATATDFADLHKDIRALFHREILIPLPTGASRLKILSDVIEHLDGDDQTSNLKENDLQELANSLFGYSAVDIHRLVDKAMELSEQEEVSPCTLSPETLTRAADTFRPSGLKGLAAPVAPTRWSDIGGYEEVKTLLRRCIEMPLKHPQDYVSMGLKPPAGVLLYGPPGCSKTMFARALATECRLHMLSVSGASIYSRYVGDSERAMRRILLQARASAPVVLFIDEIDAILPNRSDADESNSVGERVLTELLTAMDGIEGKLDRVIVLAATNRPSKIDPALLRPGRLDKKILVPLPDQAAREAILRISLSQRTVCSQLISNVESLALRLAGCSGAEVVQVVEEAAQCALDGWMERAGPEGELQITMANVETVVSRKKISCEGSRHSMEDYLKFSEL